MPCSSVSLLPLPACRPDGSNVMESVKAQVGFPMQFMLLADRCAKSTWRNPLNFKGRLAQTLFLSIVFGFVFLRLDNDLKGVQSRLGSLFFLCVQGERQLRCSYACMLSCTQQ